EPSRRSAARRSTWIKPFSRVMVIPPSACSYQSFPGRPLLIHDFLRLCSGLHCALRHGKCLSSLLSSWATVHPWRAVPRAGPTQARRREVLMAELTMQTDVKVVTTGDVDTAELPTVPPLRVRSFGLTDRGQVRPSNEDQFLIAELVKALRVRHTSLPEPALRQSPDRSYLFAVADGVGGSAGGGQASALAIQTVERFLLESCKWFAQGGDGDEGTVFADFRRALGRANGRLLEEATAHPELHGMGTTLTLAFCLNAELFVAHAGDCRCYLLRESL